MAKADLHVHSRYSEHPSDWFLQRLGADESYTDPEAILRTAKERGMDYVTITDHDSIEARPLQSREFVMLSCKRSISTARKWRRVGRRRLYALG